MATFKQTFDSAAMDDSPSEPTSQNKNHSKKTNSPNTRSQKKSSSKSSSNSGQSDYLVTELETDHSEKYILNKFLNSEVERISEKKPVPKPRTKLTKRRDCQSPGNKSETCESIYEGVSQGTYNVKDKEKSVEKTQEVEIYTPEESDVIEKSKRNSDQQIKKARNIKKTRKKVKSESDIKEKTGYDYDKIVEIVVHKTDRLLLNSFVIHPSVKIHIVDEKTGHYFPKSDKARSVVFYYENETDYILPVLTKSFNLQQNRSLVPYWEESILINEDFNYLVNKDVVFFFEILDFPTSNSNLKSLKQNYSDGWHQICFAFLKIVSKTNVSNINKKLRLQLYNCTKKITRDPHKCPLWEEWSMQKLKKYPSSFYVSINSISLPKRIEESIRSKTPLQREAIKMVADDIQLVDVRRKLTNLPPIAWKKKKDVGFRIPNKIVAEFDGFKEGCFVHKFSNSGIYLACAVLYDDAYYVIVYSMSNYEEVKRFPCHQKLIYSLQWSKDDCKIVTASSDNTVAVWDFDKKSFIQMLPHPSFVYSCSIHGKTIASGCFDGVLRIWNLCPKGKQSLLLQELEYHKGYITSILFDSKAENLYSADSSGIVCVWSVKDKIWEFNREIILVDLKGIVINEIKLFPNEKKLLIHARDSILRIVSLKNLCVLHWLKGALNTRVHTFASISSCGNFVVCGSENGIINVWNVKTGVITATFNPYPSAIKYVPTHCVQIHPSDSMLSCSHFGSKYPIVIYRFEEERTYMIAEQDEIKDGFKESKPVKKFDFQEILEKMDNVLQ